MQNDTPAILEKWLADLQTRHLADLRLPEVTRALRALSSAYVERRGTASSSPLDGTGKRAAFAMFYAPLHFLAAWHVLASVDTADTPPRTIVDVGCGTGAGAAAWSLRFAGAPRAVGLDRHPWAVAEARWTYRSLGVNGVARRGDVASLPRIKAGDAVIAAYVLNELPEALRLRLEDRLLEAAAGGARVLILEPISRKLTPWWSDTARRAASAGGRSDEWRFAVDLPELLRTLDRAAGLNHHELTVRSIWLPGG